MSDQDQRKNGATCHDVVIVGGSLTGITFALACADRGIRTRVLDQACNGDRSGGALGVDRELLLRVTGANSPVGGDGIVFPAITGNRRALAWRSLHKWLRALAHRQPRISLIDGCQVLKVTQCAEFATAYTTGGQKVDARVIVGADGYRSVVRSAINEKQPAALYAGYLMWRALIAETDLPTGTNWPASDVGVALVNEAGHRLVAYPVAGKDDSLIPGKRSISFAWYDKTRDALLHDAGCLSSAGHVLLSLAPKNIPERTACELKILAARIWPEPWRTVITHALDTRKVFATPVAEYFPDRLHRERVAIIGDAAHVVSPATGMGFVAGILDAEVLAGSLASNLGQHPDGVPQALEQYARQRLPPAQQLVVRSMEWSRAYLNGTNALCRPERHKFI